MARRVNGSDRGPFLCWPNIPVCTCKDRNLCTTAYPGPLFLIPVDYGKHRPNFFDDAPSDTHTHTSLTTVLREEHCKCVDPIMDCLANFQCRDKRLFLFPKHLYWFWCPPSFQFNNHSPTFNAEVKNAWSYTSFPIYLHGFLFRKAQETYLIIPTYLNKRHGIVLSIVRLCF
jgi:hypothetical protein